MTSAALKDWLGSRRAELDQIRDAHQAVGGTGRGRRYATIQVNHAYAMLLSSQFQGFCRDLHDECAAVIVAAAPNPGMKTILSKLLREGRKLDHGNPNPANLGADFGRFGVAFWDQAGALDLRTPSRRDRLEQLNKWRNAIAHQDFTKVGDDALRLSQVRSYRDACQLLAGQFDRVMQQWLRSLTGADPW